MPGHDAEVVGDQDRGRVHLAARARRSARGSAPGPSSRAPSSARRRSAAPAGRRSPWRSSPAGACRPRAGAGRHRRGCSGSGMPTGSSSSIARSRAARPRIPRWTPSSSVRCSPDGHQRVQRSGRVLRDQSDLAAAELAPSAARGFEEVLALEQIWPPVIRPVPGSIRRIDIAVAVLPEPLSPTSASVSPCRSVNETSRTARTSPRRVKNEALRSRTSRTGPRGTGRSSESLGQRWWRW